MKAIQLNGCAFVTTETPAAATKRLIAEVAAKHGLRPEHVLLRHKTPALVAARDELCHRLRYEKKLSTPQIGRIIGINHTSVIDGLKRHAARLHSTG
jgi:chromosomal replication initiation ATPase DnaA